MEAGGNDERKIVILILLVTSLSAKEMRDIKFHTNLGFTITDENVGPIILAGIEMKEKHVIGAYFHLSDKNYFTDNDYRSHNATQVLGIGVRYLWKPLSIKNILNGYIGADLGLWAQGNSQYHTNSENLYFGGVNGRVELGKNFIHTYYNFGALIGTDYMFTHEFGLSLCL